MDRTIGASDPRPPCEVSADFHVLVGVGALLLAHDLQ
jgi:hypothetical protein